MTDRKKLSASAKNFGPSARLAVSNVRRMNDAGARGRAATEVLELIEGLVAELSTIRDAAALELEQEQGLKVDKVGAALGVSKSRAGQMLQRARGAKA